jgi:threonine/homoserine/homoserine lactone efflux protein
MWLLTTFIIIWSLSPGPVAVMTLHEARRHGRRAGLAVAGGATLMTVLMNLGALLIHIIGLRTTLHSSDFVLVEHMGGGGIVVMGLWAGYKSLMQRPTEKSTRQTHPGNKFGFLQGMMVMATYIPQTLIYYNMIVPQSIKPSMVTTAIIALSGLEIGLILVWHSLIAIVATQAQGWLRDTRFEKGLSLATACLLVGLGMRILIG